MRRLVLIFATGFGLGCIPVAPGTWGSLLGIGVAIGLSTLSPVLAFLTWGAGVAFSILIATEAEKIYQQKDASKIVIDEICGMALALLWLPMDLKTIGVAFLLFRFFDITKISPANWLERKCAGGMGIVLDDVAAGFYARLVMSGLIYLGVV